MAADNVVPVVQKPFWQSKTFWLNIVMFLSALGVITGGMTLTPTQAEIVGLVVAAANVVLRIFFTGAPVTNIGANAAAPK